MYDRDLDIHGGWFTQTVLEQYAALGEVDARLVPMTTASIR
ncbi:hypothetical protein [Actinopolymorpha alba]|nr:hypothetical protein [Actinopolymorpha alba]